MIKACKLSFGFSDTDLYNKINFTLEDKCHCALIGSNGSGKTTLVKLIRRPEDFVYKGEIYRDDLGRIAYVSQYAARDKNQSITVRDYLMEDFKLLEDKAAELCTAMESTEELDEILQQYQDVLDEQSSIDADNCTENIRRQLQLAELEDKADLELQLLSGGEYKLVQIIRQMLRRPGLLIMDEPDVFLDFENLNGLRDLINNYSGTLLAVTHSRYLLSHCFNKIWHLENGDLQEFEGSFRDYQFALLQRKLELQTLAAAEQARIDRTAALVDKLRDAATEVIDPRRGQALKGKVSYLRHLQARQIKAPFVDIRRPEIRMPAAQETSAEAVLLRVSDYNLSFDKKLLEDVNFELKAGEKLAIAGPNGTGKTSLLRDIRAGKNPSICYGSEAHMGFFSQLQEEVPGDDHRVIDEFTDEGFENEEAIEEYLSRWCFEPDSIRRKISQLSGGEKNLLQLAKLALGEKNLLLLDEPSSHLDTFSQMELEQAIIDYPGAVIMVSHDFYTIANCMDSVLFVENGRLRPMSIRAFRKMIYKQHFSKDYLELELKQKSLESRIAGCLEKGDTEEAKKLLEALEEVVDIMNQQ